MTQERLKHPFNKAGSDAVHPSLTAVRPFGPTAPPGVSHAGHSLSRIAVFAPQTKLSVNTPGDSFEREADSMADTVMRAEAPAEADPTSLSEGGAPETGLQRKESGDASAGTLPDASGAVSTGLAGGGQPLDVATRAFMEPRFGHDFSQVKIHTDSQASQSTEHLAARAYTLGSDIAFRAGEYDPGSAAGKRLLAHELTHVVQQGSAGRSSGADKKAQRQVMRRDAPAVTTGQAGPGVQRAVDTNGGSFDTPTYAAKNGLAGATKSVGADIRLEFTPNALVQADNIGLTQTVKTFQSTTAGGPVDTPKNARTKFPDALTTGEGDVGRGIDRVDTASGSTLPTTNPLYGVHNKPGKDAVPGVGGTPGTEAVPEHASASLTDTPASSNAGFGSHKKKPDGSFEPAVKAWMTDSPVRYISFAGQQYTQTFETTALILDGPMANTYLGSVEWGWKSDAAGVAALDPASVRIVRAGAPTADFMAAAAKWNGLSFTDSTTGTTHDAVKLPVTTVDSAAVAPGAMTTRDLLARLNLVKSQEGALPTGPGVDRSNKSFERTALEAEMGRRHAKVDVHVNKKEGRFLDDKVYVKLTGAGGAASATDKFKMDDGDEHSFRVPLSAAAPFTGPVQLEAWNYNALSSDDRIVSTAWGPPFGAVTAGGGATRSTYTMQIQLED